MDYLPYIRNAIVKPLIDNGLDGIEEAINIMGKYHLTRFVFYLHWMHNTGRHKDTYADISFFLREDLDSAIEISLWPGMSDSTSNLDSKVCAILIY